MASILDGIGHCRYIAAPPLEFSRQTCICIIGASHGIGKEMARILGEHDKVKLIVTGRTKERAERAFEAFQRTPMLVTGFDLEEEHSIEQFIRELRVTIRASCDGRLDYLFLNGAQIYADGYNESYVSKDGKYDRLFNSNFMGYVNFLKGFYEEIKRESTRVVFVASVAHYTGRKEDVLIPNILDKATILEQMIAYHTSKLALVTMQQILAKEGQIVNSLAVTCGSVATFIDVKPSERDTKATVESRFPTIFQNTFQFTSQEGAEIVLNAALLPENEIKTGEFVLPYFFGFTDSYYMKKAPHKLKSAINIWYEQFLQRLTYRKGKLWICPASLESRDEHFQAEVKDRYLKW